MLFRARDIHEQTVLLGVASTRSCGRRRREWWTFSKQRGERGGGTAFAPFRHMSNSLDPLAARRSVFVEDAATLLGVSRRTVYYRIREGHLQTIRTRCGSQRVLIESIEEFLKER